MSNPPNRLLSSPTKPAINFEDENLEPNKLVGYTEFFSWGHDDEG